MTVIGRYDSKDGRWYVDPLDTDLAYESVTTILAAATGKPWLAAWSAKLAAAFAVDNLDLIRATLDSEAGRDGAIDLIKGAARRAREIKADVGTYVHDVIEALILDGTLPDIPETLAGRTVEYGGDLLTIDQPWLDTILDGFLAFAEDMDPEWEMAEATVVNREHGHAGTLDFIGRLRTLRVRTRVMGDAKTGAHLDPTMNAQLAAYRHSPEVWLDSLGNTARLPQVDRCVVLHLRTSYERGYKLLEVPADDQAYAWFLSHRDVLRGQAAQPRITGRPLYPARADGSQPPPLVEDIEHDGFNPFRRKLIAAGVRSVDDLAALTAGQLRAIKGIGPKAVDACVELLRTHGAQLAGDLIGVA
jgi:hypothetical protein